MDTELRKSKKVTGTSSISLYDAIRDAVGVSDQQAVDILGQYEVVEVRGLTRGSDIDQWQVTLKPRTD